MIPVAPISDCVVSVESRDPARKQQSGMFRYIDLSSVDKERKIIDTNLVQNIETHDAPSRARQLVKAGDVLVSTVRPNLNGVAIVPDELDGSIASTGYCVLRCNECLDPSYLYYWVQAPDFVSDMVRKATGANYPAVTDRVVKTSTIPLPPLETQKHIAGVLEQADQLRKQAQQMESKLNQLAQSLFLEMFGDLVSNTKNWPDEVLGKHAKRITVGHVGVTSEHYTENGIPFLRTQNVRPMRVNFSDIKQITPQFHKSLKKSTLKQGDVLVSRVGANRGMACIVPPTLDGANCANVLIARLADSISPVFVSYLINSDYGARTLLGDSVGSAQGVINTQKLQNWVLPFPPSPLQKKFESSYRNIQQQLDVVETNKKMLDDMFSSLIQRAFKGELTAPGSKAA